MSITNSTIGQNLLHQMPQPISSAWSLLLRADDASERIRLCWGVIDIFLRYTTTITLSHYLRGNPHPRVEKLLPLLRRPSFGHYCGIIREILRECDEEDHFLTHIYNWYFTENGAPSSEAKELDYFIAMRNRDTHHGARTSDELDGVIDSLMSEIQLFLHKAKWLTGYSLYSFSNPNMRRKGGFSGLSFRYHGQNINPLPKQKQWSCRLFPETVYVCNPEGTKFLEISPLLILESNRNNLFYLFSSTPKGLRIDSRCTTTEKSKQHVPQIHNLDVSWDEFLSKRQELDPIANNTEEQFFRIDSFFEIGMVINNRYKIKNRIGSGGMAIVFHAEDQFLEREVALKILHIEQVDSVSRERAIKEFLRMTEMNHPHIVSVYESVNLADNRVAVSMPLYEGSIKDIFHMRRPTTEQVETWTQQILNALDYLHNQEQTIIHRDIKPSNIFIDKEGNALLGDFGIARKEGDIRLTKTSEQIGSKAYMSPEQKNGVSEPYNDRYSLGITLHEIITGELPTVPGKGIDGDLGILITMLTSEDTEERMRASWPLPSIGGEESNIEEDSDDVLTDDKPEETSTKVLPNENNDEEPEKSNIEEASDDVLTDEKPEETSTKVILNNEKPDDSVETTVQEENKKRITKAGSILEAPIEELSTTVLVPKDANSESRDKESYEKDTRKETESKHLEKAPVGSSPLREGFSSKKLFLLVGIGAIALLTMFLFSSKSSEKTSNPTPPSVEKKEKPIIKAKNYKKIWLELNKDIQIDAPSIDPELSAFLEESKTNTTFYQAGKALQEWRTIAIQKIQDSKREEIEEFIQKYETSTNSYILEIVSIARQHVQQMETRLDDIFREFDSKKDEIISKQELEYILKKLRNIPNINMDGLGRYKEAKQLVAQASLSIPTDLVIGSYLNIKIKDKFQAVTANGKEQIISKSGLFGCDKKTMMGGVTVIGKLYDSSTAFRAKFIEQHAIFYEGSESTVELLTLSKRKRKESCVGGVKKTLRTMSIFQIIKKVAIPTTQLKRNTTLLLTNTDKFAISSKYFALQITKEGKKQIYVFGH